MPITPRNKILVDLLQKHSGCKRSSCRTYVSQIMRIYKDLHPGSPPPTDFRWLDSKEVVKYIADQTPLVRLKNIATSALSGLRTLKVTKHREAILKLLMQADTAYRQFLTHRPARRPFKDAVAEMKKIKSLPSQVSRHVNGMGLWKRGKFVTYPEYRVLMHLLFAHFISEAPPRRLEYADTRLIGREQFDALGADRKDFNYIVMEPRGAWQWHMYNYKTSKSAGPVVVQLPSKIKRYLKRFGPIILAKNPEGWLFLTSKWRRMSRPTFSGFVKQFFAKYLGKKTWTMNTLRSVFVSSYYKNVPDDIQQISRQMGHSIETALLHY